MKQGKMSDFRWLYPVLAIICLIVILVDNNMRYGALYGFALFGWIVVIIEYISYIGEKKVKEKA